MDLRSLRTEKGYTLKQVSDGTGLPLASIAHYESGKRQPAADVLPKLAEFYGITTDELLGYKAPNLPAVEEPEEVFEEIRPSLYGGDKLLVPAVKVEKALFNEYDKVKKSFFKMGYYLTLINKYKIYEKKGYASITDYAEDKLGIGSTNTYNFMKVYENTKKYNAPGEMEERFLPFNQSQLVEFVRAKYAGVESRVKPTDTVKDIHAYVSLWNQSYDRRGTSPEGKTVKEALEIVAEKKAKKALPQATAIPDDVPPGQRSIFDEDEESERPFDEPQAESPEEPENEFGGQEFEEVGESYSTPGVSMAFVNMAEESEKEFNEAALFLKNDTERKEFLRSAENFNIPVLRNEELGLEITKRVLRNGATIYRTQFRMYSEYHKKFVDDTVLCLVDPKEEMPSRWSYEPQRNYMSYTLTGTAETYIVQYLSKHKDEI